MFLLLLCFVLLLLIAVPIAYVLGLSSVFYMVVSENVRMLASTPQFLISSIQHFGLLAIPLFVLTGEFMNAGGITTRLVHFANVLVGHLRGGLAYVNVVSNMFLASILGSPVAQIAMMSKMMVPEMEKRGYNREFAAALTFSSGLLAPLIPPSVNFIIYGVVAEVSIARMFLGGIIPGILLAFAFILFIYFTAPKDTSSADQRATFKEIYQSAIPILPALLIPIVILAGILSGVFTATEAAAVAAFVSFIAGAFIYREIKFKDLPKILYQAGVNTAIVTIILSMAGIFSWVLTYEKIPQMVAAAISSISDSPVIFLLLVNLLLLVVGAFIDALAALIIIVPVLLPAAYEFGIDPIHFGIVVCLNLIIGLITPPVGSGLFISASTTKIPLERLYRAGIPFIIIAIIVLLIVTYVDETVLWLSNLVK